MNQFTRVFFQVSAGDTDTFGAFFRYDIQVTAIVQRFVVLGNLIGFGQIGIVVVLAVHFGIRGDGAIQ